MEKYNGYFVTRLLTVKTIAYEVTRILLSALLMLHPTIFHKDKHPTETSQNPLNVRFTIKHTYNFIPSKAPLVNMDTSHSMQAPKS
jgi:hypothetical protein